MMTAGIAAARPNAVASSASAMPGATTARLVVCDFEMPIKLFMMPQTVPNSPTNGDVAPMVASNPMPSLIRRASARTISAKLDAARSLMPASLEIPADSRPSRIAAASSDDNTLSLAPSANWACASEGAWVILPRAARSLRRITDSSMILAMKIVQVTSEAKARPIMTALTRISADRNIDQGDNSRSAVVVDFSGLAPSAVASEAAGVGVAGATTDGAVGAACAGTAAGCDAAGACWAAVLCCADDGDAATSVAIAKITAWIARREEVFIFRPNRESDCELCIRSVIAFALCRRRDPDAGRIAARTHRYPIRP